MHYEYCQKQEKDVVIKDVWKGSEHLLVLMVMEWLLFHILFVKITKFKG